jgi:hypothetical protein
MGDRPAGLYAEGTQVGEIRIFLQRRTGKTRNKNKEDGRRNVGG